MEAFHELKVNCPYEIFEIENIKISNKPNEHGYLYLKVLVDESVNFKYAIEASTDDKICIYEEPENKEKNIIFNGTIQNIRTSNLGRMYYMEIEALTSSFSLDIQEKSRSFQDIEMSYDDLIETILRDYKIYSFTQCMDKPQSIGKPLFQYKETDYEFLKRVASHLGLELICDTINTNNVFYFGRPTGKTYELEEDIDYTASIDVKKYRESLVDNDDFHPTDFFYYEIKCKRVMEIGAKVTFKAKELYVNSYEGEYVRGELIFKYKLCRKKGIWQEKLYNEKLNGISLEGKVMEVSGEQVKLHLNIDEAQNQSKAAWFRYAPPTGNLMYSMPIVGTNANLYFPSERSQDPMVIGCVRKNGGSCEKCSNVNNRYFSTESGNNLDMLPNAINFTRPGLSANFNDGSGIALSSSSSLNINAGYVGIFAGNVSIEGKNKLVAEKGESSSISLENDFYNSASIIMENGSDRASNEPFDDDPQNGAKEAEVAIEVAAQFAVGVLAGAVEGAMGKIGDFFSLTNSVELKSDSTESCEKSALESVMDFLFPPTTCYAAEREESTKNISNNKLGIDIDTDINEYDNKSYITHDDGNSIPIDSIKVFSYSEQYNIGENVRVRGYDGKWYTGTAQLDGYIGTGGYRKFKFEPDDSEAYNKGMSVENTQLYKMCNNQTFKNISSIIAGFTPADIYIDSVSFINGKDIITGEECNRGVLFACIFLPGMLDPFVRVGSKQAAKHGDDLAEEAFKFGKYIDNVKDSARFNNWDDMKEAYKGTFTKFLKNNKPKNSPDVKNWFDHGGSIEISNIDGNQIWKYISSSGDSVPYINGYVKFPDKYLHPTIKSIDIGEFTGDRAKDKQKFLEVLKANYGINEIPEGYIVHHDIENGKLLLVQEDIHSQFTHIGGHSIYNDGGN